MLETPYSAKLQTLQQRLQKHPGRENLRNRVQGLRGKQQGYLANQQAPTPYSGQYESTVAGLNRDLQTTQSSLAGQGLALEQQYGFGESSNPYSVARLLERQSQQERTGIGNSMAASGQLYAGSTSNALNTQAFNSGQRQDQALREYLAQKADLATQGAQAQNTYESGVGSAYAERLQEALNQNPDPTEAARAGGRGGGRGGGNQQGGGNRGGGNNQINKPKPNKPKGRR